MSSATNAKTYQITIYPQEAQKPDYLEVEGGKNLFFYLTRQGYHIESACGGKGTCGKCRVLLHKGAKAPTESEKIHLSPKELDANWRLCCQQKVDRDITLTTAIFDEQTQAKEQLAYKLQIELDPGLTQTILNLPKPGRNDQRPDTVRLVDGLSNGDFHFSLPALRKLPHALREQEFQVLVTHEDQNIIDIVSGHMSSLYGLTVDIGTTTLAVYLVNLATGRELVIRSMMNPQQRIGADVISRIKHVHEKGTPGLQELQLLVLDGINSLIQHVCKTAQINPVQIYKATIVGNPTMLHLFAAIPPSFIDHSPYTPVLQKGLSFSSSELDLQINPAARVYIFPSISGYIGADITAGVLFSGLHQREELSLFVDIGTNAEIVLGNRNKILSCSSPAGPAFEGAQIKYGINATTGAINYASFDDSIDQIEIQVVGNGAPKGICGSGLIDLVAELLRVRAMDEKGALQTNGCSSFAQRIACSDKGKPQFLVHRDDSGQIWLTQQDIRELQLAKGAIRAGIEIALREWGANHDDLDKIYLAGAFGNYVRQESALAIGMLPPCPRKLIQPLGNAAGQGGKLGLLNRNKWAEVQKLAQRIQYLELSYNSDFSEVFMDSMLFPEQNFLKNT